LPTVASCERLATSFYVAKKETNKMGRYYEGDGHYYDDYEEAFHIDFADPGGRSALRRATKKNPRNLPCPTCKEPNRLTPADRAQGYQCDSCADRDERGGY